MLLEKDTIDYGFDNGADADPDRRVLSKYHGSWRPITQLIFDNHFYKHP